MSAEIQITEPQAVVRQAPTPAEMMEAMISKGITANNVAAFTELVKLSEHMEDRTAKREFAAAFVRLQQDLPPIDGYRPIPDKSGRVKYAYANFEDIDAIVRPICLKHGFTYGFRETAIENGRVTVTMTLQHSGGHSREIPYSVRVGQGPHGSSESQADVSAHTYAQRGAIESGLGLRVIGRTEDPRMEGGPVTPAQAEELERRAKMTNSNLTAFLKLAGASTFASIPASKYDLLDSLLTKKEKGGK